MGERPVRVLLVEDDEDDYLLTRELLEEIEPGRFLLEWEADPDAALEAIGSDGHDVYLIDYRLGRHDGLELLREALGRGCTAPIILLTGQGDRAIDVEAMRAGAADFLVKGRTDASMLDRAIRYAIEQKRTEEQLRRARAELEARVAERTAELAQANDELRRRVEELREAKEAAEAANRAKDTLLAVVSHELRTPLTPILFATTALLRGEGLDPEARELVEVIERNVRAESRLIDDLLDVTRITLGKMDYRFEVVDVHDLIGRSLEAAGPPPGAADSPRLTTDLAAPRALVRGDPGRLQQVLSNLIRNAVKFTPAGGLVTVGTRAEGGRLLVRVADTGIGIEPESLPRIFLAFEQAEGGSIRRYGGLGLGLAISKAIVEAHGGRLEARSEGRGRGSEFLLELGLVDEAASPAPMDDPARPDSRGGGQEQSGGGLLVLLVEDDPATRRTFASLLGKSGFEVRSAGGVREAVGLLDEPFGLLLCDIALADGSGWDLIRRVRARRPDVPAIAMSGFGTEDDRRKSLEAGFDGHLIKPVHFPELLEMIDRLAGRPGAPISGAS